MSTAGIAIVVSSVSAGFTMLGLGWQVALYRLSGPRVIVRIRPTLLTLFAGTVTGPESGWKSFPVGDRPKWYVELVEVQVVNIGRGPVSISDVALDSGAFGWRRHRRLDKATPVKLRGATIDDVVRLEPGAAASTYFDAWDLIDRARRRVERSHYTIRGSALPAGRRAKRSARRKAWRISREQGSLIPAADLSPTLPAFREFWRTLHTYDQLDVPWRFNVWGITQQLLAPDVGYAAVAGEIEHRLPGLPKSEWSFAVQSAIDAYAASG